MLDALQVFGSSRALLPSLSVSGAAFARSRGNNRCSRRLSSGGHAPQRVPGAPGSLGASGSKPSELFPVATFFLRLGFSLATELLKKKNHTRKKAGPTRSHGGLIPLVASGLCCQDTGFIFFKIPGMILTCGRGPGAGTSDLFFSLSLSGVFQDYTAPKGNSFLLTFETFITAAV